MERTVSCSKRFSAGIGSVSVTTTSAAPDSERRFAAGSERMPWVATTMTFLAPALLRTLIASVIVPAVSIMSSTRTHSLPATSPTTRFATATLGRVVSRVLWTKARGAPPSFFDHFSATRMRPASGETMAVLVRSTRPRT